MRQYTFVNVKKILYGISFMNSIDVTTTLQNYLNFHDATTSFEILDSLFQKMWIGQIKRLYIIDQHYVINPCEITEKYIQSFKIILSTGSATNLEKIDMPIKRPNNVTKEYKTRYVQRDLTHDNKPNNKSSDIKPTIIPIIQQTTARNEIILNDTNKNSIFNETRILKQNNMTGEHMVTITYQKARLPIIQILKNGNAIENEKKLCFCFLIYDKINKPEIWDSFFATTTTDRYSVLIHAKNDITECNSKLLSKYIINDKYPTEWGTWSLVNVQNKLLELGLKDPNNYKFIFMSDSHIPIHDFETVFNCVMSNDFSFIDIIGRLSNANANTINDIYGVGKSNMFKTSQWTCLNREHAEMLLQNENTMKQMSEMSIIPDENAYIGTLTGLYFPRKITNLCNKNLTFVDWVLPSTNKIYRAHPRTYDNNELNKLLPTLRNEYLFVRKIAPTCNLPNDVVQTHISTLFTFPQYDNINMPNKIIVSVYCKQTKNFSTDFRNFWGFGDMIRGTISLYKMAQDLRTSFILDFYRHPIGKYFKQPHNNMEITNTITKSAGNIHTFFKYSELHEYVKKNLLVSNIVIVHNNSIYKDKNNLIELENSVFLQEVDKIKIRKLYTPDDILATSIDNAIKLLPTKYNIIHFRLGDDYFNSNVDGSLLNFIEDIFSKYYEPNDVLMTDSIILKQHLKTKFNCVTLDTNIVHIGLSDDESGISDTLVEWFVQSKSQKIKTYSAYGWISGFVFWTHQIYNIPLVNMKTH